MNEHPDDWFEDLVDRENNPDFERPHSIREGLSDQARDYAKDKVKDSAKNAVKKGGKEAAKQGGKAAAEGAAEGATAAAGGAAGGAAAGGSAAATGAAVAAGTGVETAGIGVLVGAGIAILGNKTLRRLAIAGIIIGLLVQIAITIMTVLMPIIIITAVTKDAMKAIEDSTVVRGVNMIADGVANAAGAVGDTVDAVTPWDGAVPFVDNSTNPSGTIASQATQGTLASATTSPAVLAATSYTNPVYKSFMADPSIIQDTDGTYYVYGTAGVRLKSTNLIDWQKAGDWNVNKSFNCNWAPDVAKIGSMYVLTWAGMSNCDSVSAISGSSSIQYAVSDSAAGPFTYKGSLTSEGFAIDPHVFVDTDGTPWLSFGGGNIYLGKLVVNTTKRTLSLKSTTRIYTKTSSPTIENSWIQKHGNYYYLYYSQGHFNKPDGSPEYNTSVARSSSVTGPYKPTSYKTAQTGSGDPFWGPGGGSITTDTAGNEWFIYSAWYKGERSMLIDRITYGADGWPTIGPNGHPSSTPQPGPGVSGAAVAVSGESRLAALYAAVRNQGYFSLLNTKYGLRIKSPDHGKTYKVFYKEKLYKTYNSKAALSKAFQKDDLLRKIMFAFVQNDLHIMDYSKRVTVAEKGMAQYSTSQLFVPGGETAKTDQDVTTVRQSSLQTQNSPFMSQMNSELACTTTDCGTWVPSTISSDETALVSSVSRTTNFLAKGTLRSRMEEHLKDNTQNESFLDWYKYVKEIANTAEITDPTEIANNTLIQGVLKTRKEQATRQYLHWSTVVDQYKATQLTNSAASALFRSFEGGGGAKAYRYLNGKTGGKAMKDYEKINDNQQNIIATIYNSWKQENPKPSSVVDKILGMWTNGIPLIGNILTAIGTSDADKEVVKQAGYDLGSQIAMPTCDATTTGVNFMNCLYAGSQNLARDVGISDYGQSGAITREEAQQTASYLNTVESQIAADQPLLARLTDINSDKSFARSFLMNASIPFGTDSNSGLFSYLVNLPKHTVQLAASSGDRQVLADSDEAVKINNINRAGNKLSSLLDTDLSATLDNPSGSLASCPVTQENEENLCRTDETTWLALAAKFGLLPSGDTSFSFTVGSYNILHAKSHTADSIHVGGCDVAPVAGDPDCAKTRTARQLQIITGQAGNPTFDIFGTQETSAEQYDLIRTGLPGYSVYPEGTGRMTNTKDGAVAIWWNNAKFSKVEQGKAAGISNTSANITYPWVGLQASTGQKVYVMSIHYPNSSFGGDAATIKKASRLTMDWVRSKAKQDAMVIVMGDFNDTLDQKLHYCVYTEDSLMQHAHDMTQNDSVNAGCSNPDTPGIDHIYATPVLGVVATNWTHIEDTGLAKQASDHTPVYATFTFPGSSGGTDFVMGTYNLPVRTGQDGYEKAVGNITGKQMDIVGMQEMAAANYTYVRQHLKDAGYSVYPNISGSPNGGAKGGCSSNRPIFYNEGKFRLLKTELITYPREDTPTVNCGDGEQVLAGKANSPIVWLQDVSTGQVIIVMNTHNVASGFAPNADKRRWESAKIYVEKIEQLQKDYPGIPIFFSGDFNEGTGVRSPPRNATYQGKVENLLFCMFAQNKLMRSAFGPDMKCGGYGIGGVDYIYVTDQVEVKEHGEIPGGLNGPSGSDHPVNYGHFFVAGSSGVKFNIASFNIYHSDDAIWRDRLQRSLNVLTTNKVDIAGLQEMRPDQMELFNTDGLGGKLYDMYPKALKNPEYTPNPIIWNKARFRLIEKKSVDFIYFGGSHDKAPVIKLQEISTGKEMWVANTHDPADAQGPAARYRYENAKHYAEFFSDLAKDGLPIFFTGDFNSNYGVSTSGNPTYQGKRENVTYCILTDNTGLWDAWDAYKKKEGKCPSTNVTFPDNLDPNPTKPIDHIYMSKEVSVSRYFRSLRGKQNNGSDVHDTIIAEVNLAPEKSGVNPDNGAAGDWHWPVDKKWWNSSRSDWLGGHGLYSSTFTSPSLPGLASDIGNPPDGSPIYAMLGGKVVKTNLCGAGDGMIIESQTPYGKLQIAYGHGTSPKYHVGDTVAGGKQILDLDDVGCKVSGGHVHIDMSLAGKHICPQDVFIAMGAGNSPNLAQLTSKASGTCDRL